MSVTSTAPVSTPVPTAQALRTLYFVRAAFSAVWASLLALAAPAAPALTSPLLLLYPAWDVLATFADIRANRGAGSRLPQYVNIIVGGLTTLGVGLALRSGVPAVLQVYGAWAALSGLMQLLLGLRRRRQLGGQWPMMLSGGQSVLAGGSFIVMAHAPTMGVANLAGYAAFGAFYFLLAALRLRTAAQPAA